jgi:hypothetical protein
VSYMASMPFFRSCIAKGTGTSSTPRHLPALSHSPIRLCTAQPSMRWWALAKLFGTSSSTQAFISQSFAPGLSPAAFGERRSLATV